jgi:phosphopantothenoylcysteine decarboxylase/phosphopantothenate--cysteine ligase
MSAAVADYQPAKRHNKKIKKSPGKMTLQLKPTTDILAELGQRKKRQLLIGFALQTYAARANALAKLKRKNLDYVVVNSPASLSSQQIDATILTSDARTLSTGIISKIILARKLVLLAESHLSGRPELLF